MKRLNSILTDNMDECIFTGSYEVERHHVFGGANRNKCEDYGFVVPLHYNIHPNGAQRDDKKCKQLTGVTCKEIDLMLKAECQRYYEENIGSRKEFIDEFGKSWL